LVDRVIDELIGLPTSTDLNAVARDFRPDAYIVRLRTRYVVPQRGFLRRDFPGNL
jgi:hypothetical protein